MIRVASLFQKGKYQVSVALAVQKRSILGNAPSATACNSVEHRGCAVDCSKGRLSKLDSTLARLLLAPENDAARQGFAAATERREPTRGHVVALPCSAGAFMLLNYRNYTRCFDVCAQNADSKGISPTDMWLVVRDVGQKGSVHSLKTACQPGSQRQSCRSS